MARLLLITGLKVGLEPVRLLKQWLQFVKANLSSSSFTTLISLSKKRSISLPKRSMEPRTFNFPRWLSLRLILIQGKDSVIFLVGGPWASVLQCSKSLIIISVCMAKTQYSFSHDPKLKNVPSGKLTWRCLSLTDNSFNLRIHSSDPLDSFVCRCRLPLSSSGRDANYARSRYSPWVLGSRIRS